MMTAHGALSAPVGEITGLVPCTEDEKRGAAKLIIRHVFAGHVCEGRPCRVDGHAQRVADARWIFASLDLDVF